MKFLQSLAFLVFIQRYFLGTITWTWLTFIGKISVRYNTISLWIFNDLFKFNGGNIRETYPRGWGWGEVLRTMAYTGRLRPKGAKVIWPSCIYNGGGLLAEVYEKVGKSIISVCKKRGRVNKCILWLWKSKQKEKKRFLFCDLFIV